MAHFAELDESNKVINIIVVSNEDIKDQNGVESEEVGIDFCKSLFGENTRWIQTSYNANFRGMYAGINCTYDPINDAFLPDTRSTVIIQEEPAEEPTE
jgi:hypothetical protein